MGFKHVGKSVIGKNLSEKISAPFIDLDHQIELLYENENNKKYLDTKKEKMGHWL